VLNMGGPQVRDPGHSRGGGGGGAGERPKGRGNLDPTRPPSPRPAVRAKQHTNLITAGVAAGVVGVGVAVRVLRCGCCGVGACCACSGAAPR
jgi:hypothetical protein